MYELRYDIKRTPGIYLDGDKSIKRLRSYLVGYHSCLRIYTDEKVSRDFDEWVMARLGLQEPTAGWRRMILEKAGSDELAFNLFFNLLDGYLNENPQVANESRSR